MLIDSKNQSAPKKLKSKHIPRYFTKEFISSTLTPWVRKNSSNIQYVMLRAAMWVALSAPLSLATGTDLRLWSVTTAFVWVAFAKGFDFIEAFLLGGSALGLTALTILAYQMGYVPLIDFDLQNVSLSQFNETIVCGFAIFLLFAVPRKQIGKLSLREWTSGGASVSLALLVFAKINFGIDNIILLLPLEDNEAWVGVANAIVNNNSLNGPGFEQGIVLPVLLSLGFGGDPGLTSGNSIITIYLSAFVLSPLAVGANIKCYVGSRLVFFWSFILATSFLLGTFFLLAALGHLSVVLVVVSVLFTCGYFANYFFESASFSRTLALLALSTVPGFSWFPATLFTALFALMTLGFVLYWARKSPLKTLLWVVPLMGAGVFAALASSGVVGFVVEGGASGLTAFKAHFLQLLSIGGGNVVIDIRLLAFVLLACAVIVFSRRPAHGIDGHLASFLAVVSSLLFLYMAVLILRAPVDSYGVLKFVFVFGSVSAVLGLCLIPFGRLPLRGSMLYLSVVSLVLVMSSSQYSALLNRSWPGRPGIPQWYPPLVAAVKQQRSEGLSPRPITCLSGDKYTTYICSRWSEGFVGVDSYTEQRYLTAAYLLDPDPAVAEDRAWELVHRGTSEGLDALVLDSGGTSMRWQQIVLDHWRRTLGG